MVVIDLARNVGLLISLVVLHRILTRRWPQTDLRMRVLAGLLFGGVGLLGMVTPIVFAEGIILDARSVVLAIAGLFGGPLVAAIAAAICAAYRYSLGGDGVWVGLAIIVESAALGVAFHYLRRREPRVTDPLPLLGVGVLVHTAMLALLLLLPDGAGIEVLRQTGSATLIVYPLATMLVGRVVVDGEERLAAVASLLRSEERYRELADGVPALVCESLPDSTVTYANRALVERAGGDEAAVVGRRFLDLCAPEHAAHVRGLLESLTPEHPTATHEQLERDEAGNEVWVEWTNRAFLDAAGRLERILALGLDVTERKRAEAALQASESQHRLLIEHSSDLIWSLDSDGVFTYASPSWERVTGYRPSSIVGSPFHPLVHPDDLDVCVDYLHGMIASREAAPGPEYRVRHADGTWHWHAAASAPVLGADGEFVSMVGVSRDVTERKRAEEALRRSEEHLREAHEIARLGRWELDLATGRLDWSEGVYAVLELDRETFTASYDAFLSFIHPDDRALVDRAFRESVERRQPYAIEHRVLLHDGRAKWVSEIGRTDYDDAGNAIRSVGTVQDITERKRAEEELAREHLLMETLLEGLPGIFYLYTYPELRLIRWNRNHETLLGFTGDEIRNRSIMEWHVPEAKDAVLEAIELVMEQGQNTIESPLLARDGRAVPFLMTGVRLDVGGQSYLMGVGIDVTERRRIEAERAGLEAQLQQTQRLESLGVLAGGIAHDFNNILAGVQGFTEIALDAVPAESATASYLQHALAGTARATELVRQILAFSRQAPMDQAPVSLQGLVRDVLRFARATLPTTVEIRQDLDPETPPVQADPTQIHQVVLNLCTNAEYAMRPDGGVLRVSLGVADLEPEYAARLGQLAPGRFVVLAVSDTGCGMDAATQARLFEPFFTTKPTGVGTGLGLATSHGIVTRHGGAISVESAPGVGTTFRVYLPALTEAGQKAAEPTNGELPKGVGRVLLVDDEEAILAAEASRLQSLGYTPTAAHGSTEALSVLRGNPTAFDLILSDQTMPGMTGLDLAAEVRKLNPHVPIILATGFSTAVTSQAVRELGIREVLLKPYTRRKLAEALARALGTSECPG